MLVVFFVYMDVLDLIFCSIELKLGMFVIVLIGFWVYLSVVIIFFPSTLMLYSLLTKYCVEYAVIVLSNVSFVIDEGELSVFLVRGLIKFVEGISLFCWKFMMVCSVMNLK